MYIRHAGTQHFVLNRERERERESPHSRECVGVQEERLVGKQRTIQFHEQSLQGAGIHCWSVTRTRVGDVRVYQQSFSCRESENGCI